MLRLSHRVGYSGCKISVQTLLDVHIGSSRITRRLGAGSPDSDGGKKGVIDRYLSEPLIAIKLVIHILGGITTSCSVLFWLS